MTPMRQSLVLACVTFVNGTVDWLSVDGLAYFWAAGAVRRWFVVMVSPGGGVSLASHPLPDTRTLPLARFVNERIR